MQYLLILTIFLVVMISLCVELPFEIPGFNQANQTSQSGLGVFIIDAGNPDVYIRVEAIPTEVKSGRSMTVNFEIEDKNSYDLKNVKVNVYDPCVFTGDPEDFTRSIDVIKGNRTYMWSWIWKTEKTDIDKNCNVKFRIEYEADNTYYQDLAVLSESEYQLREIEGTLKQIPVKFSYPSSPFRVSLKFSDEQPLLNNENYYMYIDYTNIGGGFLDVKSITINVPSNIKDISCKDYSGSSTLALNRIPLNFVGNRASTSTCSFTATVSEPVKISSLTLTTSYKYSVDDSIPIIVRKAV